jgi:hypothetical protein
LVGRGSIWPEIEDREVRLLVLAIVLTVQPDLEVEERNAMAVEPLIYELSKTDRRGVRFPSPDVP